MTALVNCFLVWHNQFKTKFLACHAGVRGRRARYTVLAAPKLQAKSGPLYVDNRPVLLAGEPELR